MPVHFMQQIFSASHQLEVVKIKSAPTARHGYFNRDITFMASYNYVDTLNSNLVSLSTIPQLHF